MTDCKHDWHFIEGTDRLRCQRCHTVTGGIDWSKLAIPTAQLQGYKLHDSRPNSIRFFSPSDTSTEVLRISKDGIWANPDIPTDEAAKRLLAALDSHIKGMIERMRKEELDKCCDLLEGMHVATDGNHNYYLHAANELRKLRAGK
jgi:hypothetical protein